jgi:hypothetical protein
MLEGRGGDVAIHLLLATSEWRYQGRAGPVTVNINFPDSPFTKDRNAKPVIRVRLPRRPSDEWLFAKTDYN